MSFETFIAKRYLRAKKRTGLISFTTFFSFSVIVIGVACVTIIMSIMNGFESVVLERYLAFDSHITAAKTGEDEFPEQMGFVSHLDGNSDIQGYSQFVSAKAVLMSEEAEQITTLKGIDIETVDNVSRLRQHIFYGTDDFSLDNQQVEYGIILGMETADNLVVTVGDRIWVMSLSGLGRVFQEPPARRFVVTGIFDAGLSEYNMTNSYLLLQSAQKFLRLGSDISGFDIATTQIESSPEIAEYLKSGISENVLIKTWYDQHKNLFAAMKLEKWGALLVLSLMILVASFSIACSLIMLVLEKRNEIGILKSMGGTEQSIKKIFIVNGMIIGTSGTFLGLLTGLAFCALQKMYAIIELPTNIFIIGALPVEINPFDFIIVGVIALGMTFAATLYPARTAAVMLPARALRYE